MKFYLTLLALGYLYQASCLGSVLFTGSGYPQDQGWVLNSTPAPNSPTVVAQNSGTSADVLNVETTGIQVHTYGFDTGYEEYLFGAEIFVTSASFNSHDAGFMFSPLGTMHSWGVRPDRSNSFYITQNQVGFMDLQSQHSLLGSQSHYFVVLVQNNMISLFLDLTFDQILAGESLPVLTRHVPHSGQEGVISFGDQTNDMGVNSNYEIGEIDFYGISMPAVPEPATGALLAIGIAVGCLSRKRPFKVNRVGGRF